MDTDASPATAPTLTLSELAAYLAVSLQALCDLRSKTRGPRGFRVGRQQRFRVAQIGAWIAAMEAADAVPPAPDRLVMRGRPRKPASSAPTGVALRGPCDFAH